MTFKFSTGLVNYLAATGSLKGAVEGSTGFWLDIYTGSRPDSPDIAKTGTKLLTISLSGGVNGMHLASTATAGVILKASAETWSGTILATGTAGYCRLRTGVDDGTATSTSAIRIDATIATSGADINFPAGTTLTAGAPFIATAASFTLPAD